MSKTPDQKAARQVQKATGASYQACLQELRRRIAEHWQTYDGTFKEFIEEESVALILRWRK